MPVPSRRTSGTKYRQPGKVQKGELVSADVHSDVQPSGASIRYQFPRAARLLKHSDFDRVYKQGRRHFSPHMTVFYLRQAEGGARTGFTVGRVLGGAVVRNRIKRRLREAVRLERSRLQGSVDIVINPKKSALTVAFPVLVEELRGAFTVIAGKMSEK